MGPHRWVGASSATPGRTETWAGREPEGHMGQVEAPAKAWMGRLICMQGPPRREPLPLRGFEQKLHFPSVLVSLSRSEPEQGQEQRHTSPIQPPCARRPLPEEGSLGGEGRLATRPGPGHGGSGDVGPAAQLPLGTPSRWGGWGALESLSLRRTGCPGFQARPAKGQLRSGVFLA